MKVVDKLVPCFLHRKLTWIEIRLYFLLYCDWSLPLFIVLLLSIVFQLQYSKSEAGMFSTMFEIGGVVGSATLGLILDRYLLLSYATVFHFYKLRAVFSQLSTQK